MWSVGDAQMTRTPLSNRVQPGRDKTPLGNRVVAPGIKELGNEVDRKLLDLLRSLNLPIAQVSDARERRFARPDAKLPAASADHVLVHLKDAAGVALELKRILS